MRAVAAISQAMLDIVAAVGDGCTVIGCASGGSSSWQPYWLGSTTGSIGVMQWM